MKRRDLLKYISITPLAGASIVGGMTSANAAPLAVAAGRDLFGELGVRTFINAAGPAVFVGGKLKRKNRKTRKHKKIVKTKKNMKMKKGRKTRIRGIHIKRMKQNVPRKRITKKVK